ncbi:MAG TPA: hypothetical protein VND98_10830 [Solirubrobacterales bacterium]|nr:hypothetical protein [Solirubrobacterales bacterium]
MILLAKVLLAPLCVVAVSLAGRRWGTAIAGVLGGLPVVAGPILLVITLVHGPSFGADAAAGTLLGLCALATFVVVYGRVSASLGPAASVICGWTGFLAAVAVLDQIQPPDLIALALAGASFAIGLAMLAAPAAEPAEIGAFPLWDLPARGLAAMGLVLVLTTASGSLGPNLSGLLAPFPIITSVLAVFTHAHGGRAQVRVLLRNFLVGFYGFASFCFVLAIGLGRLGSGAAFLVAIAVAVTVQAAVFALRSRLVARTAAEPALEHAG